MFSDFRTSGWNFIGTKLPSVRLAILLTNSQNSTSGQNFHIRATKTGMLLVPDGGYQNQRKNTSDATAVQLGGQTYFLICEVGNFTDIIV